MKRILLSIGAFALTAASVAIVRANVHHNSPIEIWYTANGDLPCSVLISSNDNPRITTTGPGFQLAFNTVMGTRVHLWASNACSTKPLYFK